MVSFKQYQTYKINTELFVSTKFKFVKEGNIIDEKTFPDLRGFLENHEEYEIDDSLAGNNSLKIIIGEDTHYIEAEEYQLVILKTILTFYESSKSGWPFWSWYFVEGILERNTFFVCEGDKILEDKNFINVLIKYMIKLN